MTLEWAESTYHTETVDYALKFRETVMDLREMLSMMIMCKGLKKDLNVSFQICYQLSSVGFFLKSNSNFSYFR